MTASQEFQESLQTGQITAAISLVIGKLVELEVITDLAATEATPQTSLKTHISLLTGQITTEVNPELLGRDFSQQLLAFHTAQIVATNEVVRDHLHSLRELLQILNGVVPPGAPEIMESLATQVTPRLSMEIPQVAAPTTVSPSMSPTAPAPVVPSSAKLATGLAASGMVAAAAQAGSPQLNEADLLPNKFDQVLKSAGVKEDAGNHPFMSAGQISTEPDMKQPAAPSDALQTFPGSDEEWDKWLLEEDEILSELSQASAEVAKDKIPNWDEQWFSSPQKPKNSSADWEQFIPEYIDLDAPAHRGQANVERFRQNLVNDPQLMSELLAELDDIEKLSKDEFPKP
jgi:hypothetical protein